MQVLTFGNLVDETLEAMGFAGETGNLRTIVENAVRRNHERRVVRLDYPFMRMPRPSTFSLVAGQRSYALSPLFRAPIYFRLRTTGAPIVLAQSDMLLDQGLPLESSQGAVPFRAELRGQTNVKQQPASTGVLTVTSVASDNGKIVAIQGEDANGNYIEEDVTLATSAVTTQSFATVFWVIKKAATFVGAVSVLDASANTLVSIPATSSQGVLYRHLYLLDSPTSSDVVEYDFWRLPNTLTNTYDIPNIPPPFSRILIYDALLDNVGYWRPTEAERLRVENLMMEFQHDLDSTYQEGQGNLAEASYVKLIPR